jgi:hypothetical protein
MTSSPAGLGLDGEVGSERQRLDGYGSAPLDDLWWLAGFDGGVSSRWWNGNWCSSEATPLVVTYVEGKKVN